jgi:hypothetical protein
MVGKNIIVCKYYYFKFIESEYNIVMIINTQDYN